MILMNPDHSAQNIQLLETHIYLIPNEASRPKFVLYSYENLYKSSVVEY